MRVRRWAFVLIASGLPVYATAATVWDAWFAEVKRTYPSHHLEWISDGDQDELLGVFFPTLPKSIQSRVNAIADEDRRCAGVTMGFYCEMEVNLDAFERLGLLKQFARFACHARKCEEAALCTTMATSDKAK